MYGKVFGSGLVNIVDMFKEEPWYDFSVKCSKVGVLHARSGITNNVIANTNFECDKVPR